MPQEEISRSFQNIPAGYVGTPNDAVGAVLCLLSDEARYVNGTNIDLSGAWGVRNAVVSNWSLEDGLADHEPLTTND